jgi:hypothetical protein
VGEGGGGRLYMLDQSYNWREARKQKKLIKLRKLKEIIEKSNRKRKLIKIF